MVPSVRFDIFCTLGLFWQNISLRAFLVGMYKLQTIDHWFPKTDSVFHDVFIKVHAQKLHAMPNNAEFSESLVNSSCFMFQQNIKSRAYPES